MKTSGKKSMQSKFQAIAIPRPTLKNIKGGGDIIIIEEVTIA